MSLKKLICCVFILLGSTGFYAQEKPLVSDSISIVSWNIQMLPNLYAPFSKYVRKKQRKRLPEIINYLNESTFDVVVLQEVFDFEIKRKLKKQLSENYPYIQMPIKKGFNLQFSNGIMILSKVPISYTSHVQFSKEKGNEKMAQKGCVLVSCKWKNQPIYIAGTHLNSLSQEARRKQYKQIYNKIIEPFKSDSIPFFIAGDFNTNFSSRYYGDMMAVLQLNNTPLVDSLPYTYAETNSWNSPNYNVWIDYIFYKKTKKEVILNQYVIRPKTLIKDKKIDLSDHYGIVLTIGLIP
ncbi:MAG: hypothetical protein CMD01_02975 [Flavobacteriales bacterium]|nr:hypothetical protein [Flavobacteriales bacterium]